MAANVDLNLKWEDQNVIKKGGVWTVDGRPRTTHELACQKQPSNIPGMTYLTMKVTAPVGAATPPHYHGGAAIIATVIRGRVLNQMVCDGKDSGVQIHEQGDSWYEPPGCHHVRNENAGDEEPLFTANYIIETKKIEEQEMMAALIQIDAAEREKSAK